MLRGSTRRSLIQVVVYSKREFNVLQEFETTWYVSIAPPSASIGSWFLIFRSVEVWFMCHIFFKFQKHYVRANRKGSKGLSVVFLRPKKNGFLSSQIFFCPSRTKHGSHSEPTTRHPACGPMTHAGIGSFQDTNFSTLAACCNIKSMIIFYDSVVVL